MSDAVSVSLAARALEVSAQTVYNWLERGAPRHGKKVIIEELKGWREQSLSRRSLLPVACRTCDSCGAALSEKDRSYRCNACRYQARKEYARVYARDYHARNASRLNEKSREWARKNPIRVRVRNQEWRKKNAEKLRDFYQRRYSENRVRFAEAGRRRYGANLEKSRARFRDAAAEVTPYYAASLLGLSVKDLTPDLHEAYRDQLLTKRVLRTLDKTLKEMK